MNSKILIPIVGIHSAGKSTVRRVLDHLGYVTEEECAELIRVTQKVKAGASADVSFEDLVEAAERKRDISRTWHNTQMVCVESWHILTLAYRLTRGQPFSCMTDYFKFVKAQAKSYDIHCIFLVSDPQKILERSRKLHSEADIEQYYDFYRNLEYNIRLVLDLLEFDYKVFDTMKPLATTICEVTNFLETLRKNTK